MTKKKKAKKKEKLKRVNRTAHQRALEKPETQAALSVLRDCWDSMSAGKRGEQLIGLIHLGCSIKGLDRELHEPASNLHRAIALARAPEPNGGWIGMMNSTIAKRPPKEKKELPGVDALRESVMKKREQKRTKTPARSMKTDVHSPATQLPLKGSPTPSTKAEADPILKSPLSDPERDSLKQESKPDLAAQFMKSRNQRPNGVDFQRLNDIVNSPHRRSIQTARSMTRQGKPLPESEP